MLAAQQKPPALAGQSQIKTWLIGELKPKVIDQRSIEAVPRLRICRLKDRIELAMWPSTLCCARTYFRAQRCRRFVEQSRTM